MRWPLKWVDWLIAFLPGLVMIIGSHMSKLATGEDGLATLLGAFFLAFPLSLAAGIYLAKSDGGKWMRVGIGIPLSIAVYLTNCAIAAAGCTAAGVFR